MPLSEHQSARARQLANLKNAPAAPLDNRRRVSHGGYARVLDDRLKAKAREVYDALAEDAPLRNADGSLPAADQAQVALLAECLCRLEDVAAHLVQYGLFDQKTKQPRPALEIEGKLRREAADYLDALGMTPRSRAKLGLDAARVFDLAQHLAGDDDTVDGTATEASGG